MSDTPRTDKAVADGSLAPYTYIELARQLESELATSNSQRDEALRELVDANDACDGFKRLYLARKILAEQRHEQASSDLAAAQTELTATKWALESANAHNPLQDELAAAQGLLQRCKAFPENIGQDTQLNADLEAALREPKL